MIPPLGCSYTLVSFLTVIFFLRQKKTGGSMHTSRPNNFLLSANLVEQRRERRGNCCDGRIRTRDLQIRSIMLYRLSRARSIAAEHLNNYILKVYFCCKKKPKKRRKKTVPSDCKKTVKTQVSMTPLLSAWPYKASWSSCSI